MKLTSKEECNVCNLDASLFQVMSTVARANQTRSLILWSCCVLSVYFWFIKIKLITQESCVHGAL